MKPKKLKPKEIRDINKRVSILCKNERAKHKLTTRDLAKRLGCSKSMVESFESLSDERGPAKSYGIILRLASGFGLSPSSFIKILKGEFNEDQESNELNKDIAHKVKGLSPKEIGHLLYLLETKKLNDILEISVQLASLPSSYSKRVSLLLKANPSVAKSIFLIIDTLTDEKGGR